MQPTHLLALSAVFAAARSAHDPRVPDTIPRPTLVPSAISWGDYDRDGLADAFVLPRGGAARLLHNDGDGGFGDESAALGLDDLAGFELALWGDVDGDGRLDLYLAGSTRSGRLLRQTESGRFVDATRALGLAQAPAASNAEWLDWDGDGDLDLHLGSGVGELLYSNRAREGAGFVESLVELAALPWGRTSEAVEQGSTSLAQAAPARGTAPTGRATASAGAVSQSLAGRAGSPATSSGASASASPGGDSDVICVGSLTDQASGACTEASSLPSQGFFYPLGTELNIDPAGRVGIGTLSSGPKLHVDLAANESVRLGHIGRASEIQMPYGRLRSDHDRFQILGIDGLGAVREITFGQASGNYDVTITTAGRMGIGTNEPTQRLDVIGAVAGTGDLGHTGNLTGDRMISTALLAPPFTVGSSTRVTDLNVQYLDGLLAADFSHFGSRVDAAELANGAVSSIKLGSDLSLTGDLLVDGSTLAVSSSNNRIGFGTVFPGARVEVNSNSRVTDDLVVGDGIATGGRLQAEGGLAYLGKIVAGAGLLETDDSASRRIVDMNSMGNEPRHGAIAVHDSTALRADIYVDHIGQGVVFGNIKNFVADDPQDPSRKIWYASLEGPEAGLYARGTALLVEGEATIELPAHFRESAAARGMTVLTTPTSPASQGLVVVEKGPARVVVRECLSGRGSYAFDWEVRAGRRGFEDYRVVRPVDEGRTSPRAEVETEPR